MSKSKAVILCVDDEPSILRILDRQLSPEGYTILSASSAAEALDIAAKHEIDVLITDQRMPVMSGSELLKIIREKRPEIVRIMISGYSDFDSLVSAINDGEIFRFLPKPWDYQQLTSIVRSALDQQDVIRSVSEIIQTVSRVAKFSGKVDVLHSPSNDMMIVRIADSGGVVPVHAMQRFLKALLQNLGTQEGQPACPQTVSRHGDLLEMSIAIGKDVTLKVQFVAAGDKPSPSVTSTPSTEQEA